MHRPAEFDVVITTARDGRVYLPIPFDPDAQWGSMPKHRIGGTLNGERFRGIVEAFDGAPGLLVGLAWRKASNFEPGKAVHAVMDAEGPQRADLAADLAEALAAEPEASEFWDGLAQFYRKAYLRWLDGAKTRPQLRAARIAEVVGLLKAGVKARAR